MFKAFANIFRIPELRNRVLFTLGVLAIYRIGFWIPVVGVDQSALVEAAKTASQNASGFGRLLQFASIFSGGSLGQSTIFGLGIMPYITASIILQLLTVVIPRLEALKKEGQSGQAKITQYTRYLTIGLAILLALLLLVAGLRLVALLLRVGLIRPLRSLRSILVVVGVTAVAGLALLAPLPLGRIAVCRTTSGRRRIGLARWRRRVDLQDLPR